MLRDLKAKLGLDQTGLGEHLRVDQSTISRGLTGRPIGKETRQQIEAQYAREFGADALARDLPVTLGQRLADLPESEQQKVLDILAVVISKFESD